MNPAIHIRPEIIVRIFGVGITNTLITSFLVTAILGCFGWAFSRGIQGRKNVISGLFITASSVWLARIDAVTHDRTVSKRIFPLTATFFLFIFAANLLALVPGFLGSFRLTTGDGNVPLLRSPNTDLSTTFALALISVAATQYYSLKALGLKKFIRRFVNFKNPLSFIIGFFELLSEATRLLSFSFRLFGNMFAGEVLLLIAAFILPYAIPVPFMVLELFVGFIQAFIFATLTLSFIVMGSRESTLASGEGVSASYG